MTWQHRNYKYIPLLLIILIAACATAPLTERRQLILLPNSQLVQLSLQSYQEVLKNAKIVTDPKLRAPIVRVGKRLAAATEQYLRSQGLPTDHYDWEFTLIKDDDTINAWAMPGGKIAFYTGILPITQSDKGIAVVMGHEIAHAIANHGNERLSQGLLIELGGAALSYALEEQPQKTKDMFLQAYGVGSQVGVLLPYNRMQESEADRIGLTLMAMAGYDPREAIPFWQRMNQASGGNQPPELLSTHPAPYSRIENIKKYLPEAMPIYQANQ